MTELNWTELRCALLSDYDSDSLRRSLQKLSAGAVVSEHLTGLKGWLLNPFTCLPQEAWFLTTWAFPECCLAWQVTSLRVNDPNAHLLWHDLQIICCHFFLNLSIRWVTKSSSTHTHWKGITIGQGHSALEMRITGNPSWRPSQTDYNFKGLEA